MNNIQTTKKQPVAINHISADIAHLARPIEELTLDPKNARKHDALNIRAIAESLRMFGQQTPIKALASGLVIKGNGTLLAAKVLGWTQLAVSIFDAGEDKVDGYAIQDNKSGDLASWDYAVLAEKMPVIVDDYDISAMGWKDYEIEPILQSNMSIVKVANPLTTEFPRYDDDIINVTCPQCGHKFLPKI